MKHFDSNAKLQITKSLFFSFTLWIGSMMRCVEPLSRSRVQPLRGGGLWKVRYSVGGEMGKERVQGTKE